jgi:hypothetical protein
VKLCLRFGCPELMTQKSQKWNKMPQIGLKTVFGASAVTLILSVHVPEDEFNQKPL